MINFISQAALVKQVLYTGASVVLLQACGQSGEHDLHALKPFSSDGCSLFPDSSAITSHDWCDCCFQHDVAYWRGGTAEQREEADQLLRQCVIDKTGNSALATLMYEGVRVGGSPYFHTWYRWAYGWRADRNYQALTDSENELADRLMAEYQREGASSVCDAGTSLPSE